MHHRFEAVDTFGFDDVVLIDIPIKDIARLVEQLPKKGNNK
jgi:hypothetical protein